MANTGSRPSSSAVTSSWRPSADQPWRFGQRSQPSASSPAEPSGPNSTSTGRTTCLADRVERTAAMVLPSGEKCGLSVLVARACATRTWVRCARSNTASAVSSSRSAPVVSHVATARRPSAAMSTCGSMSNSPRASGVRSARSWPAAVHSSRCVLARWASSCSQWSQWRTGCLRKVRALVPFLVRSAAVSRCLSCATPASTGANNTMRSAFAAKRNASTPSGSSVSCCGSPPAVGSSHTCMRLSASSSGLTSFGWRFERKPSAPSWRKQGAASLLSPRVSWIAALPSVGTFHRSETNLTPSRSRRCTATASQRPSGDAAMLPTRRRRMWSSTV